MNSTSSRRKSISKRIIEHLKLMNKRGDDLDGIILAIYEQKMKILSGEIIKDLGELIAKGIITETLDEEGNRRYELNKNLE